MDAGLAIREDGRGSEDTKHIGGIVFQNVIAEAQEGESGHVNLREVRPWQPNGEPLNSMELDFQLFGRMAAGWHPAQREKALREVT